MPDPTERFTATAAAAVRSAIADAGGNEVFLLGTLAKGKVSEVRVLARGNRHAAPAIVGIPRPGEVVIHNHPDGPLTPSDADLEVASLLGNRAVGSYIVDNDFAQLYVVVEPFTGKQRNALDPTQALVFLGPQGPISSALEGYEHRVQQLSMAGAVARAFNEDEVLTVEAGTGTGKSLAYLVPAILWARANKERVVISTHTINLQEQLIKKDLPFLIERAGLDCSVALVKGRGNYLCQRKAAQVAEQGAILVEDELSRELSEILAWAKKTKDGSLADLPVRPRDAVWEQVVSENDNCLRARCPFYSTCFFYTARRSAAAADVLVANHHLLMADLALREEIGSYTQNAVLPPATRVIIDEAHHLEDVATAYFGMQVALSTIERILTRLRSSRAELRGVLPGVARALEAVTSSADVLPARGAQRWIEERLLPRRQSASREAEEAFAQVLGAFDELGRQGREEDEGWKLRITPEIRGSGAWAVAVDLFGRLGVSLDSYAQEISGVLERLAQLSPESEKHVLYAATELAALQGRLSRVAEALLEFVAENGDGECRWLEVRMRRGEPLLSLHVAPVEVAPLLRKALFDAFQTVVLTSATLAVGGNFTYLRGRLGIDRVEPAERASSLLVASPFDFATQACLLVPRDLPEPGNPRYEAATHAAILAAVEATRGGTFVLFTSYGALQRAFASTESALRQGGLTPLRQGECGRHLLLSRFKREPGAVLFGTDSFWEGVDVKGDALRCVIIARLPFKVPTEPIEQARVEAIEAHGGNAFLEHAVPQAAIKLKQGFGRLIRSRDDRGCVLILDSRVVRKRYGATFLRSLPPARRVIAPLAAVIAEMRRIFGVMSPTSLLEKGTRVPPFGKGGPGGI